MDQRLRGGGAPLPAKAATVAMRTEAAPTLGDTLHREGLGVEQDLAEAVRLYRQGLRRLAMHDGLH